MPVFHLEMQMFLYLEMHIGPWKQCPPSIITNPSLFFSVFFLYFIAIFHPEKNFFLYLEGCTGPWNSTHLSPVMTTIPIFFAIFSPFYWYFSCSIAALSIFGDVHWTLKTMPNMVTNHPPFFPLFFLILWLFYCCFSSRNANVSIFGNACWTLETVPSQHHPSLFFFWFFCILLPFFIQKSIVFHIWKCALDPETIPIHHENHPYTFFPIFSLFYWYFSFSIATLSIFGNMHWTLNTMPNMVTNYSPFFLRFFCYFSFSIATLSIFGSAH